MTKLVLSDLATLRSNTALTTINTNWDLITAAINKTLFRDGTSPNSMAADLDMNSFHILNLPEAALPTEPVRLDQVEEIVVEYAGPLIAVETAARIAAVAAEATIRSTADSTEAATRAAAITTEANARIAADSSEASTRAANDTTETNARISAITTETTNRTNADTALSISLSTEITNRTTVDTNLLSLINSIGASSLNSNLYDTRAAALLATIPSSATYIHTSGYASAGDGGHATYKKVGSQPSHSAKIQSADGAWWEFFGKDIAPEVLGVVSGTGSDQFTALQNWLTASVAVGAVAKGTMNATYRCEFALQVPSNCIIDLNESTFLRSVRQFSFSDATTLPMFYSLSKDKVNIKNGYVKLDCSDTAVEYMPTNGQTVFSFIHEDTNPDNLFVYVGSGDQHGTYTNNPTTDIVTLGSGASVTSLTISLVDATNNRLTITNHGLFTGQKVAISSSGTIPGGITANQIYYVAAYTKDILELYTSLSDAYFRLHGRLDITSAGTGTITLRYGPTVAIMKQIFNNRFTGVLLESCTNSIIENVQVRGLWYDGIQLDTCTDSSIIGCQVHGVINRGMYLYRECVRCSITDYVIDGRDITTPSVNVMSYGLALNSTSGASNNQLARSLRVTNGSVAHIRGDSTTISGNLASTVISNLSIEDGGDRGIYCQIGVNGDAADHVQISNVNILGMNRIGGYGCYIFNANYVSVSNVHIRGADIAVYTIGDAALYTLGNKVSNVSVEDCNYGLYMRYNSGMAVSNFVVQDWVTMAVRLSDTYGYTLSNIQCGQVKDGMAPTRALYLENAADGTINNVVFSSGISDTEVPTYNIDFSGTFTWRTQITGVLSKGAGTGVRIPSGVASVQISGYFANTTPVTNAGTNCTVTQYT